MMKKESTMGKRNCLHPSLIVKETKDIVSAVTESIIITIISDGVQVIFNVILIKLRGSFFIYLCSHEVNKYFLSIFPGLVLLHKICNSYYKNAL